MKNGWNTNTLDEMCQFLNGLWKGEKPPFVNVGVIRNTNFTREGVLDETDIAYLDVEVKKFEKRRLRFGDIILEKSGGGPKQPVGRVVLFDKTKGEFSFSNFTSALRILDPNALDFRFLHKFLYWAYLSGVTEGMQSHSTGIRNLNGEAYKRITIDYPSLAEQQRIVGILDEAFTGIATAKANAEKNLQNARSLFESHLRTVFADRGRGWVKTDKPLADLCLLIVDCEHKTAPTQETGIPSIRTPNIGKGKLLLEGVNFVSEATYDKWTRRVAPMAGDLILAREAPAGNVAVIPDHTRVCLGQRTVLIRPRQDIFVPSFLAYLLLEPQMRERLLAHSRGATVQHVNLKDIRALDVGAIPSLEAQRQIAAMLNRLSSEGESLVKVYERKLEKLYELKKSLLHQAFSGALTRRTQAATLVQFPVRIPRINTTDLHAGILAIAYQLHERQNQQAAFGHVKAEKIAHMVEAHLGIDLGRKPLKDAAGPNDFPHLIKVEARAVRTKCFRFDKTAKSGYRFTKLRGYDRLIARIRTALGERNADIDALLELMVRMTPGQAEILATVYAAWNNLMIDNLPITDEAIVFEARENWHEDKYKIPRHKFFIAIEWMKKHNLVPIGKGKKVTTKSRQTPN
jgi:type I restriction enzyme S subunit